MNYAYFLLRNGTLLNSTVLQFVSVTHASAVHSYTVNYAQRHTNHRQYLLCLDSTVLPAVRKVARLLSRPGVGISQAL